MRLIGPHSWACDRARHAASLRLDVELSQLERALLDRHLAHCPSCAAFASDVGAVTNVLRTAPLVPLDRPIALPLRRRVSFGVRRAGAWVGAASLAATAVLAMFALPTQRDRIPSATSGVYYMRSNQDLRDLRVLRSAQMKPLALILARRPERGPELDT